MSNTIKLKRGSGSNPSASDLAVGEVALRTDLGKLFTKKDNGNVAEIGGSGISDGDKGDITVSNSGDTFTIDNGVISTAKIADNAVELTKIQDILTSRIIGRSSSGTGNPQQLTAANVRSIINVEDGATADQSASEILTLLKTVDGSGSGLVAERVTVTDNSSDTSCFVLFTQGATGDQLPHSGSNLTFNASSGLLTATGFAGALTGNVTGNASGSSGSCTGNAATATKLATARNIAGVSFDGSANISLNNNAITNGAGYVTSSVINSLNASNLTSGTIPDARFPSTLPAVDGSNLTGISAGATGGGSDEVFYENDQTVTTNYTITNGKNAMAAGPITINSGVTVTVGSGETLTIV